MVVQTDSRGTNALKVHKYRMLYCDHERLYDSCQFTSLFYMQYTHDIKITDIDECKTNPCQNNGVCINTRGSFSCKCQQGWTSKTCQQGWHIVRKFENISCVIFLYKYEYTFDHFCDLIIQML